MSTVERRAAFAEHAYNLSELGWPLIRADGKSPFEKGWPKTSTVDPDTAASLWVNWGLDYNMGVVLSGANLAVLEYDREEARSQFLALLGGDFPLTPTCVTGSAKHHVYFRDPGGLRKATRDGLELRVGAHQCLVPPSEHPDTGKPYTWIRGREPWEVEPLPLPEHVRAFFEARGAEQQRATSSSLGTTPGGTLPLGESLRRFNADEGAVEAMAGVLGIPRLGGAFRCILHPDRRPSASLVQAVDGVWLYRDWHAKTRDEEWLSLPVVCARLHGRTDRLSSSEVLRWQARLLVDAGVLEPAEIGDVRQLPDNAPASARRVYEGFLLLLRCKWLDESRVPTTFSRRFAAAWCGISEDAAQDGIRWLQTHGFLDHVGELDGHFPRGAYLWLPGGAEGS